NAYDRAIKIETGGALCENTRAWNTISLPGSPAPTGVHRPDVTIRYLDCQVVDSSTGNFGLQARANHHIHEWCYYSGTIGSALTVYIFAPNAPFGGDFIPGTDTYFKNILLENCAK